MESLERRLTSDKADNITTVELMLVAQLMTKLSGVIAAAIASPPTPIVKKNGKKRPRPKARPKG